MISSRFRIGGALVALHSNGVDAVLREMHRHGVIAHHRAEFVDDRFVDLQISAPRSVGGYAPVAPDELGFAAVCRVHYHEYSASRLDDPGTVAVVEVTVRGFFETPADRVASIPAAMAVPVSWALTTADDLTVRTTGSADEITARLLTLIQKSGGGLFSIGAGRRPEGRAILPTWDPSLGPTASDPQGHSAGSDWVVTIPAKRLVKEIRRRVRAEFGAIPSSEGDGEPVLLALTLDRGRDSRLRRSVLTRMRFGVEEDALSCAVDVSHTGHEPYTYEFRVDARVGTAGPVTDQTWSRDPVPISDSAPVEADVTRRLHQCLRDALAAPRDEEFALGGLTLLSLLFSGGQRADMFNPVSRAVRDNGLIVCGTVAEGESTGPHAEFAAVATHDPRTRAFHATESWSPGGCVTRLHWDFGDGATAHSTDLDLRMVERHTYAATGDYAVTLTVTDATGRTAAATRTVTVGAIRISRRTAGHAGSVLAIEVSDGEWPVLGAQVTLDHGGKLQSAVTDAHGLARFPGTQMGKEGRLSISVDCGGLRGAFTVK